MNRRKFLRTLLYGGGAVAGYGIVRGFVSTIEYLDMPGPVEEVKIGREKNSIAALVAGLIGQKMYGNSEIDLNINKSFFPDARVTGNTTKDSVDTYVNLALTSARFNAKNNSSGYLEGEVKKSEFNWNVKQTSEDTYKISRFGFKFNNSLELNVSNGNVSGVYKRSGTKFNWKIDGSYDKKGNVNVEIDGPANLGITLEGKIRQLRR